jgi:hypothetical protein
MATPNDDDSPATADLELVSIAERPDLAPALERADAEIYPTFMTSGQDNYYAAMERMGDAIAPYRLAYLDPRSQEVLGATEAAPIVWDGTDADLPRGYDDSLERTLAAVEGDGAPTALCALNLMVSGRARGMGLSARLLRALAGRSPQYSTAIAAIRPPLKERYPEVAIDKYVGWTRDDGSAFDPWIRSCVRAGARLGPTSPRSLEITGSVAQWREWTGIEIEASGEYAVPLGIGLLEVDLDADLGTYSEPSVWIMMSRAGESRA